MYKMNSIDENIPDYKIGLSELSQRIVKSTGIEFTSLDTLYLFSDSINDSDVLFEFFDGYLWKKFSINHGSIAPKWLAFLPIISYIGSRKFSGYEWKFEYISQQNLQRIHRYFILSQFCDWNTKAMIKVFMKRSREAGAAGLGFPLAEITEIALKKGRMDFLGCHHFLSLPWLAAKILMPHRFYIFLENGPQVDHVFPLALSGQSGDYRQRVDVLWNFQPMPPGIHRYKRAQHPKDFFNSEEGVKYMQDYDFIPPADSAIWNDDRVFIQYRQEKMQQFLSSHYGLELV